MAGSNKGLYLLLGAAGVAALFYLMTKKSDAGGGGGGGNPTITYDADSDAPAGSGTMAATNVPSPFSAPVGTVVPIPSTPSKLATALVGGWSFVFMGWLPVVPATMPSTSMTCVAQWGQNLHFRIWNSVYSAALPGAVLTINGQSYTSNAEGRIEVPKMPAGIYPFTLTKAGYNRDGYDNTFTISSYASQPKSSVNFALTMSTNP